MTTNNDFWTTSDNTNATQTETPGEYHTGGGTFEPIPDNTDVLATIDTCGWDEYMDEENISLKWKILQPSQYANRKIFQTLRVDNDDSKKADKAKRMLAAIDANAGKKLTALKHRPTEIDLLRTLTGATMVLKLTLFNGKNYVIAISPQREEKANPDFDNDVPF